MTELKTESNEEIGVFRKSCELDKKGITSLGFDYKPTIYTGFETVRVQKINHNIDRLTSELDDLCS